MSKNVNSKYEQQEKFLKKGFRCILLKKKKKSLLHELCQRIHFIKMNRLKITNALQYQDSNYPTRNINYGNDN